MNIEDRSARRARWMADAQQGDRVAYAALLDDVGPLLQQFVRRRVRDAEEAKDVYQDVMLAVHRARHTYEPAWPLEPWLFAIARRIVTRRTGNDWRVASASCCCSLPGRYRRRRRPEAGLAEAPRALSPTQREALPCIDGLSMEAAAPGRTSVGALRVRAHRYQTLGRFCDHDDPTPRRRRGLTATRSGPSSLSP
jgi:RNA polymerase sigma-70 factor (ECF subfamily)